MGGTIYNGMVTWLRPDVVPGQPFYLHDPTVPGHRRFNAAAFKSPPLDPDTGIMRQGSLGRNVLRELALYQVDLALGRRFTIKEGVHLQFKGELFNIFNHPMFGSYSNSPGSDFGVPQNTLNFGSPTTGQNQLYAMGGPRSVQLSLKVSF